MSNKLYFTPGPSQLFYSYQDHFREAIKLDIPSISHRSSLFIKVVEETTEALHELLGIPEGYQVFFINSANEAWDRIIQNLVNEHSHHFVNGAFSKKFYDFALQHGKKSTRTIVDDGQAFVDLSIPEGTELIGVTKNETSVGYSFLDTELETLRTSNPECLIALDIVSASPSVPVNLNHVDTAYLSVQKAFGMPAGLGLWIANNKCIERSIERSKTASVGSYRSLENLSAFAAKNQTPETPNMLGIFILGRIAKDLLTYGVKRVQNDTIYKATLINQTIDTHPNLEHFVSSEQHRSRSTLVAAANHPDRIIDELAKKGMIIGSGYGPHKKNHIRIANFPTHSKESVEMLCDLLSKIE